VISGKPNAIFTILFHHIHNTTTRRQHGRWRDRPCSGTAAHCRRQQTRADQTFAAGPTHSHVSQRCCDNHHQQGAPD
jgi:hypothetical protein